MSIPSVPAGWTRAQGYPKWEYPEGVKEVVERCYKDASDFDDDDDSEVILNLFFGNLAVNSLSFSFDEAKMKVFANYRYSLPNSGGVTTTEDGHETWSKEDSGQEIPIDKLKNNGNPWFPKYKTNHNYILSCKSTLNIQPPWWETATNTVIPVDEGGPDNYKWVKETDSIESGWKVLKDKTKKIETVIAPSPVVIGRTKYQNYNQAVGKQKVTGSIVTPEKDFGYTDGKWLVMSSDVYQDGRRWVVETRYQYAEEWDSDYYA